MKQVVVFLAVLCCVCEGVKFGQLCSGNPGNTKRGSDGRPYGSGHYGASRGSGTHRGLDIKCTDGQTVYAPFDVIIERRSVPYTDPAKAAINNGILMRGGDLCFKLFYIQPVKTSGSVRKGQKIGTMLPMQSIYPGITSHVHVQMCDSSDPTRYF